MKWCPKLFLYGTKYGSISVKPVWLALEISFLKISLIGKWQIQLKNWRTINEYTFLLSLYSYSSWFKNKIRKERRTEKLDWQLWEELVDSAFWLRIAKFQKKSYIAWLLINCFLNPDSLREENFRLSDFLLFVLLNFRLRNFSTFSFPIIDI